MRTKWKILNILKYLEIQKYNFNKYWTICFTDSSIAVLAKKNLDVNPKTIYNWIREYKKVTHVSDSVDKSSITNSYNIKETTSEELKRLRTENKLL